MRNLLLCLLCLVSVTFDMQAQTRGPGSPLPASSLPSAPLYPGRPSQGQEEQTRAINQGLIRQQQHATATREADLRELHEEAQAWQRSEQAREQFRIANQRYYKAVYLELQAMLDKPQRLDLKRAIFQTENAFLNGQLHYDEFTGRIDALTDLCRRLAGDSALPDPGARFMALHRLMTDTVRVRFSNQQTLTHAPPRYDFKDFLGQEDHTRQFVYRLLVTNAGQCHSMPLLYKLLADELGIKAYLSMAPSHSYIQVKDNRGALYSYETTNGHFVSDAYYMTSGYIKAGALRHRAYLDTLTQRETLACTVFDLAHGYVYRYGYDAFAEHCVALGLRYYPQSVEGRMMAHDAALLRFVPAWKAAGQPAQAQARQLPRLCGLLEEVEQRTRAVDELGYEEMPAEQYRRWLQQVSEEQARTAAEQAARFKQTMQK